MEQVVTITTGEIIKWFLALATGSATIRAGVNAISKLFTPHKEIKKQVGEHKELLKKDNDRIKECENANTYMCRAMLALLDHELTGNGVERLRAAKDELQRYLTER